MTVSTNLNDNLVSIMSNTDDTSKISPFMKFFWLGRAEKISFFIYNRGDTIPWLIRYCLALALYKSATAYDS